MKDFIGQTRQLAALQSKDQRSIDVAFLALVAAVLLVVTVGAAWSLDARRDALADRLDALDESASSVVVRFADLVDLDGGPAPIDDARLPVDEAAGVFPDPLARILDEPEYVIDTGKFTVDTIGASPPGTPSTVNIRFQSGLDERSTVVDGRRPDDEPTDEGVEVVMSVETAAEMSVDVGDVLGVSLDLDDPLARRNRALPEPFVVVVVGIVELTPLDDSVWFGDARLHRPVVNDTPLGAERVAYVAAAADAVDENAPFAADGAVPLAVELRTRVDVDRITVTDDAFVRGAIAEIEATTTRSSAAGVASVVIGMGDELDRSAAERSAASDLVDFVVAGWLVVVVASLGELNRARLRLRGRAFALLVRRGAMRSAVLASASSITALLAALGAIVGVAAGAVLSSVAGFDVALGLVAMTVGLLMTTLSVSTAVHVSVVFRAERSTLPGGLRVRRVDARPPGWGRLATAAQVVIVIAWAVGVALFARTGPRSVDLLAMFVVFGLSAVATVLTHRRAVRDSRWSAFAVGAAVTLTAVVVIGLSWSPSTDGPVGLELAEDVRAQLLLWVTTAVASAAVAVVARGAGGAPAARSSGLHRSTDALLTSCLVVLAGTALVGSFATERIDLDGIGGPGRTGLVAAAVTAAVLAAVAAIARGRLERRISPSTTGVES